MHGGGAQSKHPALLKSKRAGVGFGANGQAWILGQTNVATAITRLAGPEGVQGAMMQVVNNDAGTDDTALSLAVQAGEPPMTVNSGKVVTNLNADKLDGVSIGNFYDLFLSRDTYRNESAPAPGTPGTELGDGTYNLGASCDTGDVLLSGGPANIDPETDLLESYPSGSNSWTVRVNKNGFVDDYSVVVLCAWQ